MSTHVTTRTATLRVGAGPGPGVDPRPPESGARRPAGHEVLVVDDDEAFARTVADALEDRDIRAHAVCSPREALELARETPFAAAVVDLVMPEMDGLAFARELRRRNPGIEVVLLTGHADVRSAIEAVRNEVFDYLQKDALQAARLRRAVHAAISRGELRAENRRLVSSLQESTRRLAVLNDLTARLAAEHHLDDLSAGLLTAVRDLVGADTVRVLLMEKNELGDMKITSAWGDGEVAHGTQFGPGDGIATGVAASGIAVRAEVAQDHSAFSPRCDEMGTSLPHFVCVPLARPGVTGAISVAGRARPFTEEDVSLLVALARQGAVAIENARAHEIHANFFTHASEILVSLLDAHDVHYHGHSRAVAALADMVARRLELPDEERRHIHFAALLHDVGKLRLGPGLLATKGRLTPEEKERVRQHPALGVEILRPIARWSELAPVIHSHHERWDGRGYPRGLAGTDIPLGGRIVAIAEAFEAMVRSTPYSVRRTSDEALAEVEACAGTQFDPILARLFVAEYVANRDRLGGEES
jgi:putative nucleotidyltransferase with HDIG domain